MPKLPRPDRNASNWRRSLAVLFPIGLVMLGAWLAVMVYGVALAEWRPWDPFRVLVALGALAMAMLLVGLGWLNRRIT